VPAPVLAEVDYFLSDYVGTFRKALEQIRSGALIVEDLTTADYERVDELMGVYADLKVGFVDCGVLAIVERLGEAKLATLDHRHFATMRPRHVEALVLARLSIASGPRPETSIGASREKAARGHSRPQRSVKIRKIR
jgi:uncharacterized protein